MRGDMRRGDLQPLLADRGGDVVQQSGPVAAIDLDDRVGVGGMIVHHDPRWSMDCPHAPAKRIARHFANFLRQPPAGPTAPVRSVKTVSPTGGAADRQPLGGVLDPERIQRHAVGHGMDARIDDRRAGHRQSAGDPAEQPRMVGGVDVVTSVTARAGNGCVSTVSGALRCSASRSRRAWRACESGSNDSQ